MLLCKFTKARKAVHSAAITQMQQQDRERFRQREGYRRASLQRMAKEIGTFRSGKAMTVGDMEKDSTA